MHSVSRTAKKLGAAVALSFAMAMPAAAADINTFIISGANQASDEDREYLIDRNPTNPVGVVAVGDSLRGFINFNTINSGSANLGGATGVDEFTGVFQVLVTSIIPAGTFGGVPISLVTFGPDPAFIASLAAMGIVTGPGTIAALFTDPSVDFCADFGDSAACNALTDDGTAGRTVPPSSADVSVGPYVSEEALGAFSTDGLLWATIGFTGAGGTAAPGEGIDGFGPTNILSAFGLTSGSTAGLINAGLNLITTGPGFDPSILINRVTPSPYGGFVDFALSQQLRGVADLDTPFEIATNTNVSFNATRIPEPSTLLLLGGALAVLGWSTRRRNAGV